MPAMRSLYVALVAIAGCAQAGSSEHGSNPDASVTRSDGSIGGNDSSVGGQDSTTACTTMTTNLLANGNFDAGGTGWTVTPILTGDPIINTQATDGGPVGAQSPTYRAWMGGVEDAPSVNKDAMYQDVAIPPSTTALEFTGYYEVRSAETDATAYDKADVELVATTGTTQIELIKHLDDNGKTTSWTTFQKTIAATVAGTTVRLKFSTAGDGLYATSFYFDSVALNATYCQ
jgi:hypothetical protein